MLVPTGDELLHHRLERLCERVGALDLGSVLAKEGLTAVDALEDDVVGRLHQHGITELLGALPRFGGRAGVSRVGRGEAELLGLLELVALALHALERLPGRERVEKAFAEDVHVSSDRVQVLVVCREDGSWRVQAVRQCDERADKALFVRHGLGGEELLRIARSHT